MAANILAQAGLSIASEVGNAILGSVMGAIFGDPQADLLEVAEQQLELAQKDLQIQEEQLSVNKQQLENAQKQLAVAQETLAVAKETLVVLKEVSVKLSEIKIELVEVNANLRAIKDALERQFEQVKENHIYKIWADRDIELIDPLNIITTRFKDYKRFVTPPPPDATGKQGFPLYPISEMEDFKKVVRTSISGASTAIHSAIMGTSGSSGILELLADVISYDIVFPSEKVRARADRGDAIYSEQLNTAITRLTSYYTHFLIKQFYATILLMEVDNMPDENGNVRKDFAQSRRTTFLEEIELQHESYFNAIWKIIVHWLKQIDDVPFPGKYAQHMAGFEVQPLYDKENKIFSKLDLASLSTLLSGGASGFDLGNNKQIQPWLLAVEQLVSAFSLDTTKKGRFVVYGFAFSGVSTDDGMELVIDKMKKIEKDNTNLLFVIHPKNGSFPSKTSVTTTVHSTHNPNTETTYALLRQVIDADFSSMPEDFGGLGVRGNSALIDTERTITLGFNDVPDSKTHEFADDINTPGLTSSKYAQFMGSLTARGFGTGVHDFMPFAAYDSGARHGLKIVLPNNLLDS